MRLIDADALKKSICYNMPTRSEVNILVDAMPDAIVRCKDCTHRDHCELADGFGKSAEWFCADGERAEAEVEDGN